MDKDAREKFGQEGRIAILASMDDDGCPHLSISSSLQSVGDTQLSLNLAFEESEGQFFRYRPDAAFLVQTRDMRWLRGSMHYTRCEDDGGVSRMYFFDLISIEEIRKLPMRSIFWGTVLSRVKVKLLSAGAGSVTANRDLSLFSETGALKFLCWEENRSLSDIVPISQAVSMGRDRIVFSSIPYGEDFADAAVGAKAAVICLKGKRSVLVKGTLVSNGVLRIECVRERAGAIQ